MAASFLRNSSPNNDKSLPLRNPRIGSEWGGKLILVTFILAIFEGAIRKWVFAGSPPLRYATYLSKDMVFFFAALAGAASATATQLRFSYLVLIVSVLLVLPPSLVHLGDTSVAGAVLSSRAYI